MFVKVTGGMSLVEGILKPAGTGACGRSPERSIGGWSSVEIAGLFVAESV